MPIKRNIYPAWRSFFDVDGLTSISLTYEDRVIEIQRQMAVSLLNLLAKFLNLIV